jgi:type I restriction enzyme R subunit
MEPMQVYTQEQIDTFVGLYLGNAPREELDPIIDVCVEAYKALDLEDQIAL